MNGPFSGGEFCEERSCSAAILHEHPVEINETQQMLQMFAWGRGGPSISEGLLSLCVMVNEPFKA